MTKTLDTRNWHEVKYDMARYREATDWLRIYEQYGPISPKGRDRYAWWQSLAIGLASKGLPEVRSLDTHP